MTKVAVRKRAERRAREDRVDDILSAAVAVFVEKGYESTAVSEIAARIGVVEGTIYKYFDSKRELLLRVLEHWYEQMFGDYAKDLAGLSGAHQRVRFLIWRHLRTVKEQPQLCKLMFREFRSEVDYHGSELHAMNRRYTQFLVDAIQEGVQNGEFRNDLPLTLVRDLIYGGIEHHGWAYLCGRGDLDIDRLTDQIMNLLCTGIETDASGDSLSSQTERLSQIAERIERSLSQPASANKTKRLRKSA
jgi:AcrR family transcriptional regulator